jgi:hypothetical protein
LGSLEQICWSSVYLSARFQQSAIQPPRSSVVHWTPLDPGEARGMATSLVGAGGGGGFASGSALLGSRGACRLPSPFMGLYPDW